MHVTCWGSLASSYLLLPGTSSPKTTQNRGLLTSLPAAPVLEKRRTALLPWPLGPCPWPPLFSGLPGGGGSSLLPSGAGESTREEKPQRSLGGSGAGHSGEGWEHAALRVRLRGPLSRPGPPPRWCTTSSPSWASACSAASSWLLETAGEVGPERPKGRSASWGGGGAWGVVGVWGCGGGSLGVGVSPSSSSSVSPPSPPRQMPSPSNSTKCF